MNPTMDAHEYIKYELEFDLNNPYKPIDEDIVEMLLYKHQGTIEENEGFYNYKKQLVLSCIGHL